MIYTKNEPSDRLFFGYYSSPMGQLQICSTNECILAIEIVDAEREETDVSHSLVQQCVCQLQEFFAGARNCFDLPLSPRGTLFQQQVWQALQEIPYGEVRTYKNIADTVGSPNAVRAVGSACGKNPICIVIPCHRVIGSNGALTGYAYGVEIKKALLEMEQTNKLVSK